MKGGIAICLLFFILVLAQIQCGPIKIKMTKKVPSNPNRRGPMWSKRAPARKFVQSRLSRNAKMASGSPHSIPISGNFSALALYYITFNVGSDNTAFTTQVDTGSADIGLPQKGCQCGRHPNAEWDPEASNGASAASCRDRNLECTPGSGTGAFCKGENNACAYTISYEDGSGFSAQVYNDTVSIGGMKINSQFVGGIYKENTGGDGPFEPYVVDGIAGFGFKPLSVVGAPNIMDSLSSETPSCVNTFSMCGDQLGGVMTLCGYGDHHSGDIKWTPMTQLDSDFYNVYIAGLSVYGEKLDVDPRKYNDGLSTVDSGTTIAYFPSDAYKALEKKFRDNCNKHYLKGVCDTSKHNTIFAGTCVDLSAEDLAAYPNITMILGEKDQIEVEFPPASYMLKGFCNTESQYTIGIASNGPSGSLLGDPIMIANEVVYDVANKRMGFAPKQNCGGH